MAVSSNACWFTNKQSVLSVKYTVITNKSSGYLRVTYSVNYLNVIIKTDKIKEEQQKRDRTVKNQEELKRRIHKISFVTGISKNTIQISDYVFMKHKETVSIAPA